MAWSLIHSATTRTSTSPRPYTAMSGDLPTTTATNPKTKYGTFATPAVSSITMSANSMGPGSRTLLGITFNLCAHTANLKNRLLESLSYSITTTTTQIRIYNGALPDMPSLKPPSLFNNTLQIVTISMHTRICAHHPLYLGYGVIV